MRGILAGLICLAGACTTYEPLEPPQGFLGLDAVVEELPDRRGALGIQVEPNESESLEDLQLRPGVRVLSVVAGSAAESAGVRAGDVLLRFDGTRVDDPDRLESLLLGVESDREVVLTLERGSRVLELDALVPAVAPQGTGRTLYYVDRRLVRAAFENSRANGAYPVVAWISEDSPLNEAEVRVGDTVTAFQGQDPGSARELVRRFGLDLAPGDEATLELRSEDGSSRVVTFEAWDPGRVMTKFMIWPLVIWELDRKEDKEELIVLDLILISGYKQTRVASEYENSILGIFGWKTGEALLESSQEPPVSPVGGP